MQQNNILQYGAIQIVIIWIYNKLFRHNLPEVLNKFNL